MMRELGIAVVLVALAAAQPGCGADGATTEAFRVRGCDDGSSLRLQVLAGAVCDAHDPTLAAGPTTAPIAQATWLDPGSTPGPRLRVDDGQGVSVAVQCVGSDGIVRRWGCDDERDGLLEVETQAVCRGSRCFECPDDCPQGSHAWTGAGETACVAACDGGVQDDCETGDPLANGGCDWTCNDPEAPDLRLTAIEIEQPAALAGLPARDLLTAALDDGGLVWLIDFEPSGRFVTGDGGCERGPGPAAPPTSRCSFTPGTHPPATGDAALDTEAESFRLPASGTFDVDVAVRSAAWGEIRLPLRSVSLDGNFQHAFNCIGSRLDARVPSTWDRDARLRGAITVADARGFAIEPEGQTLCDLLARDDCRAGEPASWADAPDTTVGGEPAWSLAGWIAAIGVELVH